MIHLNPNKGWEVSEREIVLLDPIPITGYSK
jgi:hypothetical protein